MADRPEGGGTNAAPAAGYRLSPQQARAWSLSRQGDLLLVQGCLELVGKIDREAFRRAARRLATRHEILRTVFRRRPGMALPLQVILPPGEVALEVHEVAGGAREAVRARTIEAAAAARRRGFDVESAPAFALDLVAGDDGGGVALTLSALCGDVVTIDVLAEDLAALYDEELGAERAPEPEGQYADFADALLDLLEAEDLEDARDHWRRPELEPGRTLAFADAGAEDRSREPARLRVELGAGEVDALVGLADARGCSLELVLLASFAALLARATGEGSALVAVACGGRTYQEMAAVPGPFARYVPLLVTDAAERPAAAILESLSEEVAEAAEWQEFYPGPGASGDGPASFPVGFDHAEMAKTLRAGGLELRWIDRFTVTDRFDLRLASTRHADGLTLELVYDPSRVPETVAGRLAQGLGRLLAAVATAPEAPLADVELQAAFGLVGPELTEPGDPPVHELFLRQARRDPLRTAVVAAGQSLTYGELDRRSGAVAAWLELRGVTPGRPVALLADRGLDTVVGLLGILRAGGAWVPLDPALPDERLKLFLEVLDAPLLLAEEALAERAGGLAAEVLSLSRVPEETGPAAAPEPPVAWDQPAYVVFTSGSTGVPKGVGVSHRALAHYTRALRERIPALDEGLAFALVSTFAADLGYTCLFPALVTGGSLHVVDRRTALSGEHLAAYLASQEVDVLKIVPSHLQALLDSVGDAARLMPRRVLLLGGEVFSAALRDRLVPPSRGCRVVNHYGPTETTVGVTTWEIDAATGGTAVPIGLPLPGVRLYVVDRRQRPVFPGAPGELLAGGPILARGYWERPAATAQSFVPDPFSGLAGARLYRTGDRVRVTAAGPLLFLGRVDHQVKIRGFRVEPGEIEAALAACPDVERAVVLARATDGGGTEHRRLVAWVQARTGAELHAERLRSFLEARLPDAMVPSLFVPVESFPLTPNGKVDRGALPAPQTAGSLESAPYRAPRNRIEETLTAVWAEVLGVERVGIDDDYFVLGGDSITSIRVMVKLRPQGIELTPLDLFRDPTVARLAAVLEERGAGAAPAAEEPTADAHAGRQVEIDDQTLRGLVDRMTGG